MPRRACDSTVKQTKCNLSILKGTSRCWAFLSSIWIGAKCENKVKPFLTFFGKIKTKTIKMTKDFSKIEVKVDRLKASKVIESICTKDLDVPLTLFKNEDSAWLLSDGWNGISYIINDLETKNKLDKIEYGNFC